MLLCTKSHYKSVPENSLPTDMLDSKKQHRLRSMSGQDRHSPYTGVSSFIPTTNQIYQFSSPVKEPSRSQRVVYIDGAWDLFHVGHVRALKLAREYGDYVIVGVLDDQTVNSYKGRNLPIMNLYERVLSVLSCRYVDEVVIGSPLELTTAFLDRYRIEAVVAGTAETTAHIDGYAEAKRRGIFHVVDSRCTISAEWIMNKIMENRMLYEERNRKKEEGELRLIDEEEARRAAANKAE